MVTNYHPPEVDLHGYFDEKNQVRYIGLATQIKDDKYKCLAVARGALCVVEVTITLTPRMCGACSEERHADCSGWCFCNCEYNQ